MDRLDLIEGVKMELGHPVITLFVTDEQIDKMINKAIRRCQSKVCPTFIVSKTVFDGKIDIVGMDVEAVKNIYGDIESSGSLDLFGMGINTYPLYSDRAILDAAVLSGKRAELEKFALSDYYLSNDSIYVDNYKGLVTVEYVKKNIDFEDLDTEWRGWVESYVTALAKVIEGRIRGKYKPQGGPFEVEADTLVSEGTSTIQDLDSKLENSMGYYTILR
jgi:hypothetical protein